MHGGEQVSKVVKCAAAHHRQVVPRGGGHRCAQLIRPIPPVEPAAAGNGTSQCQTLVVAALRNQSALWVTQWAVHSRGRSFCLPRCACPLQYTNASMMLALCFLVLSCQQHKACSVLPKAERFEKRKGPRVVAPRLLGAVSLQLHGVRCTAGQGDCGPWPYDCGYSVTRLLDCCDPGAQGDRVT